MDVVQLKKNIAVRLGLYAFILATLVGAYYFLNQSHLKVKEKLNWLQNDINAVNNKLDNLNKKTLEFSEAVKAWEGFEEKQKKLQGLRINESKDLLDRYKEEFKLSKMNIEFSKPEELEDEFKTDVINTISSSVSISFSSITDELAFQFLYALIHEFPGYIEIKSFSLTRTTDISKVILEDIARGDIPALVNGRVDFSWRDLKYTAPKNTNEEKS